MELSPASYYYKPKISRAEKEQADADIRGKIENVRLEFRQAGYRMLLHNLKKRGVTIGERRLRRIIRENELQIKPSKKFVATTDSKHDFLVYPNLLPEMRIDNINQVWTGDITYIRINNGFVYLAAVLELYSRKIIGWSISKKIDRHLTLSALEMAIKRSKPGRGVIHHTDRGVQYLCNDYSEMLLKNGFKISCSRKGNPYDNSWTESLMKTLKYEEIYLGEYETYLDVIEKLPYFIEEVYNKKRLHSSLGYMSPEEFEEVNKNKKHGDRPSFKL